jgi:hypothetical protein
MVRRFPPVGGDIAQRQPDQLAGRLVGRKMTPRLDDFPQTGIHTFDRVGGLDHPPDLGREGEERNHLLPRTTPGGYHSGKLPSLFTLLERAQRGRFGAGRGIDRAQRAASGLRSFQLA